MADQEDSTATSEQVPAAGGVTRRRRGASASGKRRSPSSGARRRAPTPEPPKDVPLDDEEEVAPPVRTKKKSRDKSETRNRRSLSSPGEDRIVQASSGEEGDAVVAKIAIADGKVSATETIVTESKRVFKVEKIDPASLLTSPEEDVKRDTTPALPDNIVETKAVVEKVQEPPEKSEKIKETKKTSKTGKAKSERTPEAKERMWRNFIRGIWSEWLTFKREHQNEYDKIVSKRNQCFAELVIMIIYCGLGGLVFRFTEGAFESFYKCGVKRVKRNFIDDLWLSSHNQREEDWKSNARRRLMEFENQLHAAHEAGVHSYSGQRSWSFLNAVLYCLTVVTTIGYGHISPSTTTGRAITIVYAIFGIPLFLILLADFGKLFTRGIKFLWAFVRRLYYTGSCKRVRRTAPVQEVWKGVQLVYDFATFRRPSQIPPGEGAATEEDEEASVPLQQPQPQQQQQNQQVQQQQQQLQHDNLQTVLPIDGLEPGTPAPSAFEVDDEFNLPISIAIFILLAYIFVGASVYFVWEEWGFFESFYFVFISMSTIGFGDFVPQHPMYMMASIVYLVFGLALTSMCINVVQIKLSDSFRQASAKLGATIGLRMAEEEAALTPSPVVEVTDVQPTITKSLST